MDVWHGDLLPMGMQWRHRGVGEGTAPAGQKKEKQKMEMHERKSEKVPTEPPKNKTPLFASLLILFFNPCCSCSARCGRSP